MKTASASFNFSYELLFIDGSKELVRTWQNEHGAYDAREYLLAHGVELSHSTILNSTNARTHKISKMPYNQAESEQEILAHFNDREGWKMRKQVVEVHIVFKRTK